MKSNELVEHFRCEIRTRSQFVRSYRHQNYWFRLKCTNAFLSRGGEYVCILNCVDYAFWLILNDLSTKVLCEKKELMTSSFGLIHFHQRKWDQDTPCHHKGQKVRRYICMTAGGVLKCEEIDVFDYSIDHRIKIMHNFAHFHSHTWTEIGKWAGQAAEK